MKTEFSFSREHTEIIKGIAILLMLIHHLFGFPEWYTESVSYIGINLRANTLEYVLGQFGHICVSLFAFITGYGMYFSYRSGNVVKKSLKKIVSFLISYWLVIFIVAIPINLALGKSDITLRMLINNMFGYTAELVPFAWYVRFYLEMVITLPLFYFALRRRPIVTVPLFMLVPAVANIFLGKVGSDSAVVCKLVYYSMEYFLWITCSAMGMCFVRYGIFEKADRQIMKLGKCRYFICIALAAVLMYLRAYKKDTYGIIFSYDCIYAPVFIYLAVKFANLLPVILRRFLILLGGHSMNIWFVHSFFFFRTAELMKYAYAPKIPLLIVAWVILLCLPISYMLNFVSNCILKKLHIADKRQI